MKYLKSYRLFENRNTLDYSDIDYDEDIMEKYYKNNFEPDEEDYDYLGDTLLDFVDNDQVMEDEKDVFINDNDINNYEKYYKQFIVSEFNYEDYDKLDFEDYEYDHSDFSDEYKLKTTELVEFIEEESDEEDFLSYVWDEISGSLYNHISGKYGDDELYQFLKNYINHNELNDYIKDNADSYEIKTYFINTSDDRVKGDIMDYENSNAVVLMDLTSEKEIYNEAEYQLMFVIEYVKMYNCVLDEPLKILIEDDEFFLSDELESKYPKEIKKIKMYKELNNFGI